MTSTDQPTFARNLGGRPPIGPGVPAIGPYQFHKELRDAILDHQARGGFAKQAEAFRDLVETGLARTPVGRPPAGPEVPAIGPYRVSRELRDAILNHTDRGGFGKQARAVQDLIETGLGRAVTVVPADLRARVDAYVAGEDFDDEQQAVRALLDDALDAAGY